MFQKCFTTMKKSCCFTLTFTSKSVKHRDIVLQGLYTMHYTFYMSVCNIYIIRD